MRPTIGDKYLITTDAWFFAPNGQSYRAVWGTVHAILNDEETLGIKTNSRSSNWYVSIGNMLVAGCQIHYAIKCDYPNLSSHVAETEFNGEIKTQLHASRIYNADPEVAA